VKRALVVAAAIVCAVMPTSSAWVERTYSTSFYIALQRRLTALTNYVPISLLEVGAVALAALFAMHAVGRWRSGRLARMRGQRAGTLAGLVLDTAALAAVVYLLFLALWGLNYRRASIVARFDHDASRVTAESVDRLARFAASRLNALHPVAHARSWPELGALPASMGGAFAAAQRDSALDRIAVPGRPKWTLLTPYFVRAGIDGMTDPFFLEVLVNGEILPFERHSIVAHEWAHLAGFAHEAEAGFLGWLTTTRGDEQAQYSGWLTVYAYAAGALDDERQARLAWALESGPTEDLRAIERRVAAAAPGLRAVARTAYDRFLRANRVESGVRSYGELVTLIAGCRVDRSGRPVRRSASAPASRAP
jgi:Protein of unknown function (DUF3810)